MKPFKADIVCQPGHVRKVPNPEVVDYKSRKEKSRPKAALNFKPNDG
jgi:hypothetical protein